MKLIDLHAHSTFSDGSLDPAMLIDLAERRGLAALALTDHDTVAGVPHFLAHAANKSIRVIGGIEISAWYDRESLHILGYGLDHTDRRLNDTLSELQRARHQRNLDILDKLNELGIDLSYDDLETQENSQIGRPHLARALIRRGMVRDSHEAFNRLLRQGAPAYVEGRWIHAIDAIRLITAAGGAPVLAHPALMDASLNALATLLPELRRVGLIGLEVHYPTHSRKQRQCLLQLAAEHRMIATGGTDFHDNSDNGIPLGGSCRSIRVPYSCYQELVDYLENGRPAR
ncbi:MAG: PHP domain-containing protein [Desulfobulbaceae bacterium]|nr:MAG: PHP domain-containing protein [Desulfobulbaceae bacterium]